MLYSAEYDEFYLGSTTDLKRRYEQHKKGENKSTRKASDWKVVYYEVYQAHATARRREASLKRSGKAYVSLKQRIRAGFNDQTDNLGEGEALDRSPSKRRP